MAGVAWLPPLREVCLFPGSSKKWISLRKKLRVLRDFPCQKALCRYSILIGQIHRWDGLRARIVFILVHGFWSSNLLADGPRVVIDEAIFVQWSVSMRVYKHERFTHTWPIDSCVIQPKRLCQTPLSMKASWEFLGWTRRFMCSATLLRCIDLPVIACMRMSSSLALLKKKACLPVPSICQPPLRNEVVSTVLSFVICGL